METINALLAFQQDTSPRPSLLLLTRKGMLFFTREYQNDPFLQLFWIAPVVDANSAKSTKVEDIGIVHLTLTNDVFGSPCWSLPGDNIHSCIPCVYSGSRLWTWLVGVSHSIGIPHTLSSNTTHRKKRALAFEQLPVGLDGIIRNTAVSLPWAFFFQELSEWRQHGTSTALYEPFMLDESVFFPHLAPPAAEENGLWWDQAVWGFWVHIDRPEEWAELWPALVLPNSPCSFFTSEAQNV